MLIFYHKNKFFQLPRKVKINVMYTFIVSMLIIYQENKQLKFQREQ